jgi:hypothetical protein
MKIYCLYELFVTHLGCEKYDNYFQLDCRRLIIALLHASNDVGA